MSMTVGVLVAACGLLIWHSPAPIKIKILKVELLVRGSVWAGRGICALGALVLIIGGIGTSLQGPPASPTARSAGPAAGNGQPPGASTTPGGAVTLPADPTPPSSRPAARPPRGSADVSVGIVPAYGAATLGQDVQAIGHVRGVSYSCVAVGWHVVTSGQWTADYIKTLISPGPGGSFTSPVLQLGSPGETGSTWNAFILGATASGCAWLQQLWAQTPTGEYRGSWPPTGITVLSQGGPIHRTV